MYEKNGDAFKATVEGNLLYMIQGCGKYEVLISIKISEVPDLIKSLKEVTCCTFGVNMGLQVLTNPMRTNPYLKLHDGRCADFVWFSSENLETFINYLENKISE
jgi:hypothetical protein